jgi:hypothetical protein
MTSVCPEDALADYVLELLDSSGGGLAVRAGAVDPVFPPSRVDASASEREAGCLREDRSEHGADSPSDSESIAVWILGGDAVSLVVPCDQVSRFAAAGEIRAVALGDGRWACAELEGVSYRIVDPLALLGQTTAAPELYVVCSQSALLLAVSGDPERTLLSREDVVWRGTGGQRPWLAGTAPASRCALLDLAGLERQLSAAASSSGT